MPRVRLLSVLLFVAESFWKEWLTVYGCSGKWASTKIEGYLYSASLLQGFKVSSAIPCRTL